MTKNKLPNKKLGSFSQLWSNTIPLSDCCLAFSFLLLLVFGRKALKPYGHSLFDTELSTVGAQLVNTLLDLFATESHIRCWRITQRQLK